MDKERLEKFIKKISILTPYRNKSREELHEIATKLLLAKERESDINIDSIFISKDEKKQAQVLLKKYLEDYTIETISDKNTLKQLIYLEILNYRLQTSLNDIHANTAGTPKDLVKTVHENIMQITTLKDKLGLTRQKEQLNSRDGYGYLVLLQKKYKKWLEENQASRYMTCPHCGKSILMKIKIDKYDAQKHPFFKDRILGNTHLIKLYEEQKLSKDDLSKIFETSLDYIDWLISKWNVSIIEVK